MSAKVILENELEEVDMEQEKDNFWLYIGGLIVFVIALVFVFKNTHKEAIPEKAYQETSKEIDEQIAKAKQQ
ncbi:hypothetical protein [Methylococcus capsulatus]|nr:hypothetical protein [Methylococcus capsulatus]